MDAERNVSMDSQNGINLGYLACKQEDVKTEQTSYFQMNSLTIHNDQANVQLKVLNPDEINSQHQKKYVKHANTRNNNSGRKQKPSKRQREEKKLKQKLASENGDNLLGVQLKSANTSLNKFVNQIREHKNIILKLSKCMLQNDNLDLRKTLTGSIHRYCDQILKLPNNIATLKKEFQIAEIALNQGQKVTQQKKIKRRLNGPTTRLKKKIIKKEKMETAIDNKMTEN